MGTKSWHRTDSLYTLFVILITLLLYRDTLSNEGIYDDNLCCLKNPGARPSKSTLFDLLKQDFWGVNINAPTSNTQWRPLTVLTYRLDYSLWCEADPRNAYGNSTGVLFTDSPCLRGWRRTNLALAALVAALVYATSRLVVGVGPSAALASGLLFAAHPVHIESHATLYGRADVICAALHLAACCLASRRHFAASFGVALLSITAKESGLGTLLAVPLCAWMAPCNQSADETQTLSDPKSKSDSEQKKSSGEQTSDTSSEKMTSDTFESHDKLGPATSGTSLLGSAGAALAQSNFPAMAFCVGMVLAASVVMVRRSLITRWGPPMSWMDNPYAFLPQDFAARWLSITHIHSRYFLWLFAPLGHSPNYGWDTIPPVVSLSDPRNVLTGAAYLLLAAGVAVALARQWWREVALIAWAGALFLPASNVFFYVGTAFADRLLYLPSVPFCLLLGSLLHRALTAVPPHKGKAKILLLALAGAAVAAAALTTAERVPAWRNGGTVWEAAEKQFPRNAVAIHNLALDRQMHNRQAEAAALFKRLAETLEGSEFEQPRNDRLVKTGKEASMWAEKSAEGQVELKKAGPKAVLELVKKGLADIEEGKALVEPFALLRDVLLSGVMEDAQEVEDWILKNTFALHVKHNRVRDLFQIVRMHVIPRRKRLFLDWSVPKEIVDLIAPMIDGEI